MKSLPHIFALSLASLSLASLTSCETRAGTGALIGGAGGAGLGALVDDDSGRGAVIGGAAGAVTGAVVGDAQEERRYDYR